MIALPLGAGALFAASFGHFVLAAALIVFAIAEARWH